MKDKEIKAILYELEDQEYRDFQSKLCPGVKNIIGVRIPKLREIAKKIAKEDWQEFLRQVKDDTYEEMMLQGLVIGYAKADLKQIQEEMIRFIPKIDNWAVCDTFCNSLKIANKYPEEMWKFILPFLETKQEFQIRFVIIMMLSHYLTEDYIDRIISYMDQIKHDGYYVKMGIAWTLSMCFVKFPQKTMRYLKKNNLDKETYQKTLQKIIESNQVDKETKVIIKQMKPKKSIIKKI